LFSNLTGGLSYYVKFIKPNGYGWTQYTTGAISTDYNSDAMTDGMTNCIEATNGVITKTVDA
jgi:hypothetical protein